MYKNRENNALAKEYYLRALSIDREDRYALMGLAELYHKTGQEELAIAHYEQVLKKNPGMINILTILGNLHRRRGDLETAREYFERALALEPDNAYALYGLGHYYRWRRDYPMAISLWEKVLELSEGNADLFTRLGDAYRNTGDTAAAEASYRKALDKGDDKFGLLGLARLHAVRGELDQVTLCYRRLARHEDETGWFFGEIAAQLTAHRQRSDVENFYLVACELQQGNQGVARGLARQAEKLGLR